MDALITQQTSPPEAYKKLDDLANRHTDILRRLTKQVQESRSNNDSELVKKAVAEYEDCYEKFIPVLMAQAKIYWDLENYNQVGCLGKLGYGLPHRLLQVEKIFRKSVEFCNENDTWRLNVAHVLFMQGDKYKEATQFYEPIVKKNYSEVSALEMQEIFVYRTEGHE